MNEVSTLVDILRRLAGRLPDSDLATLRSLLAARELEDLERSLACKIEYYGIDLTPPEQTILRGVDVDSARCGTAPAPQFTGADPDGSSDETDLLVRAVRHPSLRRIVKARRHSAPEADVYVVVCAAGTDVSRLQNGLELHTALVEVVAEDEQLPPYQAAALAAGRLLWPR